MAMTKNPLGSSMGPLFMLVSPQRINVIVAVAILICQESVRTFGECNHIDLLEE